MLKQPYFFARQFICILIEINIIIAFLINNVDTKFLHLCELMLLITVSETFLPYILKGFHFSEMIDAVFYYLPFYYHIIYITKFEIHAYYDLRITLIAIGLTFLLLLANLKGYKITLTKGAIKQPLSTTKFINQLLSYLIALVSEEIVFRLILLNICTGLSTIAAVLLSAILFTFSHYINRWANSIYKVKSYLFIFLIGVVLALLYVYTKSLLLCIVIHMIYNSSDYIVLIKRLLKKEELLFDDY